MDRGEECATRDGTFLEESSSEESQLHLGRKEIFPPQTMALKLACKWELPVVIYGADWGRASW
jgi:hypothetical protein